MTNKPRFAVVILVLPVLAGCGILVDKDRIKIARIDDKYVVRGDLNKAIREMPDDEKRIIQTKGDALNFLQEYLDTLIKDIYTDQLLAEEKIHVPREAAAAKFLAMHPEFAAGLNAQQLKELGGGEADQKFWEEEREARIDRELRKMQREYAIGYLISEAVKNGTMPITEEEYAAEYEMRKERLFFPERVVMGGVYFPDTGAEARSDAAQALSRLRSGEKVDEVAKAYVGKGAGVLRTAIENDARLAERYRNFWQQASGAQDGSIVGPIYIQGWECVGKNIQGQVVRERLPKAYLVCVIEERKAPVQKTVEQAKQDLMAPLLYAKMMDELRTKHGVEVYEDKLADPSMHGQKPKATLR
jgi:PPIC-type PPIASE domain